MVGKTTKPPKLFLWFGGRPNHDGLEGMLEWMWKREVPVIFQSPYHNANGNKHRKLPSDQNIAGISHIHGHIHITPEADHQTTKWFGGLVERMLDDDVEA